MSVKRCGGAFGGKITRSSFAAVACALGAYATRRYVRHYFCALVEYYHLPDLERYLGSCVYTKPHNYCQYSRFGVIVVAQIMFMSFY